MPKLQEGSVVVLDTNIWISENGLRSAKGALVRYYLGRKKCQIGVPEVIKLEVEHHLAQGLHQSVSSIQQNYRQLLGIFGRLKELVLPSADEINTKVSTFFDEVDVPIVHAPFSLESARASFLKTIKKVAPSERSQQFKDGVIWSDCLRLLKDSHVCLVTEDKAFFSGQDAAKGILDPALMQELMTTEQLKDFSILPSLNDVLSEVKITSPFSDTAFAELVLALPILKVDDLLSRQGFTIGSVVEMRTAAYATERATKLFVEFTLRTEAVPLEDSSQPGTLTIKGDCIYDTASDSISSPRIGEERLTYRTESNEEKQVVNMFANLSGGSFLGHRNVEYSVRRKLSDL